MRTLRSKKVLVLLASATVAGIVAAVAIPAVISQQTIAEGNAVHFRVQKTSAVDFDSGWHVHPGVAIVQVQQGSFQIYQGSCTAKTVNAGDTYIEIPYEPVRAIAKGPIVWTTTIIANGSDPALIPLATYAPGQAAPCPEVG